MKLYLSSYRVPTPQDLFGLVGKKPSEIKIALIPNAKDYYVDRIRDMKIKSVQDDFSRTGITNQKVVDLRHKNSENLRDEFNDCNIVWCMGGNTFMLMEAIQNSGFAEVARELLSKGVVYGGESAGAIVAGSTLRGVEFADEPEFAETLIWDGMNLVDNVIVPHVGSEMFGSGIAQLQEIHKEADNVIEITDNQAYVVNEDKRKIVTGPAA